MDVKIDINLYFSASRKMLFLAAHTEGTAECLGIHEQADLVFKRCAEFQLELLQTLEHVLKLGLIRHGHPAHGPRPGHALCLAGG